MQARMLNWMGCQSHWVGTDGDINDAKTATCNQERKGEMVRSRVRAGTTGPFSGDRVCDTVNLCAYRQSS